MENLDLCSSSKLDCSSLLGRGGVGELASISRKVVVENVDMDLDNFMDFDNLDRLFSKDFGGEGMISAISGNDVVEHEDFSFA